MTDKISENEKLNAEELDSIAGGEKVSDIVEVKKEGETKPKEIRYRYSGMFSGDPRKHGYPPEYFK